MQAVSITEAKLKMSDISCAVHVCSLMHQRYSDFAQILLENWLKYFPTKKDEKVQWKKMIEEFDQRLYCKALHKDHLCKKTTLVCRSLFTHLHVECFFLIKLDIIL